MSAAITDKDRELLNLLNAQPTLRCRVEELMQVVEDNDGDIEKADAAEQRIIEEVRKLGHAALTGWAECKKNRVEKQLKEAPELRSAGKKLWWRSTFDIVEVEEPLFRKVTHILRTFSEQAGVTCRSVSLPLQRVITDFGADLPFGQVNAKLQEHYGIEVPVSGIRMITEHHGKVLFEHTELATDWPDTVGTEYVIAETDGGMVPVFTIDPEAKDKRKGKQLGWQELRLCMAHEPGSRTVYYGGNFSGGIEETGRQLFDCAVNANAASQGERTRGLVDPDRRR